MNNADKTLSNDSGAVHAAIGSIDITATLKPKGACWYCNAPLDNVKRFCNKICAEDYRNEEETFRDAG